MAQRRSPRVALFVPNLGGGGAERVMVNLANGLMRRGLEVDLLLAQMAGPFLSEVASEVRLVEMGAGRVLHCLPGLVCYLRRERPRALLSTLSHANIVAIWARQLARVPVRLVVRETSTAAPSARGAATARGRWMPLLMRLFYRYADVVIANSEALAEDLMRVTWLPESKVRVIYNPVITSELLTKAEEELDHSWFQPGEPPVVLGVGRLVIAKDFATLIRAFAVVRREHRARLLILGEGEERSELGELVQDLGLEGDVDLAGFVHNPFKYMKRAAVFVLSSRWEGLPNVLIQALAIGPRLVATDCPGGASEILEGGRWGRLVPVGSVEKMAQAIQAALMDRRPSAVPQEAWDRFSLDSVAEQYFDVLQLT